MSSGIGLGLQVCLVEPVEGGREGGLGGGGGVEVFSNSSC